MENSQDICGYYWNCHEQHAQQLCESVHFHCQMYMHFVTDRSALNFLPGLSLQHGFDLAWRICLFHFLQLSWLLLAPTVVDMIR